MLLEHHTAIYPVLAIFRQVFLQEFASFDDNATRVRISTKKFLWPMPIRMVLAALAGIPHIHKHIPTRSMLIDHCVMATSFHTSCIQV